MRRLRVFFVELRITSLTLTVVSKRAFNPSAVIWWGTPASNTRRFKVLIIIASQESASLNSGMVFFASSLVSFESKIICTKTRLWIDLVLTKKSEIPALSKACWCFKLSSADVFLSWADRYLTY